jgi:5'-methylthioadenosine phosphorylase
LRQRILQAAREQGASVHDGGSYVNMEGPAFSTRAESIANHQAGFSVIGMTNLGEAKCAREAEIAYATMAMVTDYDAWKVDEAHVTVDMVIENLTRNTSMAKRVLASAIPKIPLDAACSCHSALKHAVMTPRDKWPDKTSQELALLLGGI